MNIRRAASADRTRIEEILVSSALFRDDELSAAMHLVDLSLGPSGEGEYEAWVLEMPGEGVSGYVLFGPTPRNPGVWDLYWIAVDARLQGRGHGTLLLRFVEREIGRRGGRIVLIETSAAESFAPTRRFYEGAGYRESCRIKDFRRIESDRVVFSRSLEP